MDTQDVGQMLRDGDPLLDEPLWPVDDVTRVRRITVAAASASEAAAPSWPRPALLAASLIVVLAAGIAVGRNLPPPRAANTQAIEPIPPAGTPSQLQFATPGGTRVIWVFNPDLSL